MYTKGKCSKILNYESYLLQEEKGDMFLLMMLQILLYRNKMPGASSEALVPFFNKGIKPGIIYRKYKINKER